MSWWPKCLFVFHLALILYVALCLAIQPAHAQVVVDVWTNKGGKGVGNLDGGTYSIGEYVQICFYVDSDVGRLRFHVITPDNRDVVYYHKSIQKGTYCISGYEIGPPGVHRVIVEAWEGDLLIATDEVDYNVVGCPPHGLYIGLEIYVGPEITVVYGPEITSSTDDLTITVTGWVKPTGIDWNTFKSQCYAGYPGKDYYHVKIIRDELIRPTLGVDKLTEITRGIDDSKQVVWTEFKTKFSNLRYSDYELKVLRFEDSIKRTGGFIDEVKVESSVGIWKAAPQPTYMTSTTVYWRNSRDTAPDRYEIYLYPVVTLRITAEEIPPDKTVSVLIDGRNAGVLSEASPVLEWRVKGLTHEIDLEPRIITLEDKSVRYSCQNCPTKITVNQSSEYFEVVLSYKKEFKIILDVEPRVCGVKVDGDYLSIDNLPYETWWPQGSRHQISPVRMEVTGGQADFERKVYRFAGWSDGQKDEARSIEVNGPLMLKALYNSIKQYKVVIESDYGDLYGVCGGEKGTSLWCDYGSFLSLDLASDTIYISDDTRAIFSGWVENGRPVSKEVIVDSAKHIRAIWTFQYFVRVEGVYTEASGWGWYDEGADASIAINKKMVYVSDDTRYVFEGWGGDCIGEECGSEKFIVKVSKPLSFIAVWRAEHRVRVYIEPTIGLQLNTNCGEWVREGGECVFNAPAEYGASNDTLHRFVGWEITVKEEYGGYEPSIPLTEPSIRLRVDNPVSLTAKYEPWYKIHVDSLDASFVRGECEGGRAFGELWCKDGTELVLHMPITSKGFLVTQEFKGWSVERDSSVSEYDNEELTLIVGGPARITAVWTTNYTGLQILILGVAAPSTYILYALSKKKNVLFTGGRSREVKETLKKLRMLEEAFKEGKISREAYLKLKEEYEEELRKRESKPPKSNGGKSKVEAPETAEGDMDKL